MTEPVYRFRLADAPLGAQMLFVAFGATVLVPLLTGLNPNVALFTAGIGTLLYQVVTRGRIPIFLGSSFAFIAPIIYGAQTWGMPKTLSGLAAAGVFYLLASAMTKRYGVRILERLVPPIVTGPVIMVIGLVLAPVAVNMAMGKTGDGAAELVPYATAMTVAGVSLLATILVSLLGRGVLKLVPILCGVVVGYGLSLALGLVSFAKVAAAPWLAMPEFIQPEFHWPAVLAILPVAIAPAIEHFGGILAIGSVTGENYLENPGIHRSLLGDGLAVCLAALLGGPPVTTYAEVTGAVALTRATNPAIMTWAAITAILLAFVGKLGAMLQTIPTPVMGGIMVLLFGAITVVGVNTLVRAGEDLLRPRNMTVAAIILVLGIGRMHLQLGGFALADIGLAGIAGVLANLLLPRGQD